MRKKYFVQIKAKVRHDEINELIEQRLTYYSGESEYETDTFPGDIIEFCRLNPDVKIDLAFTNGKYAYSTSDSFKLFVDINGDLKFFKDVTAMVSFMSSGLYRDQDHSGVRILEVDKLDFKKLQPNVNGNHFKTHSAKLWSPYNTKERGNKDDLAISESTSRELFKSFWEKIDSRISANKNEASALLEALNRKMIEPRFIVCNQFEIVDGKVLALGKICVNIAKITYIKVVPCDSDDLHLFELHLNGESRVIVSAKSFVENIDPCASANKEEASALLEALNRKMIEPRFLVCNQFEIVDGKVLALGKICVNIAKITYIKVVPCDSDDLHLFELHLSGESRVIVSADTFLSNYDINCD